MARQPRRLRIPQSKDLMQERKSSRVNVAGAYIRRVDDFTNEQCEGTETNGRANWFVCQ